MERRNFLFSGLLMYWVLSLFAVIILHPFIPLVHADTQNLTVTGTVLPRASDFQLAIAQDKVTTVPQGTIITYTITYGSHLYYADQLKIEAEWNEGTIAGADAPSVYPADYALSSATNAYNSIHPVIDLVNQKIDWTIPSFPSQTTNQTVTFQLKMNGSYAGTGQVDFPVKVRLIAPRFITSDQLVTSHYQFDASLVTPTPTMLPTATPKPKSASGNNASTPTPIPSVTPIPTMTSVPKNAKGLAFSDISYRDIAPTSIALSVLTTNPATLNVHFGTTPNALSQTQTYTPAAAKNDVFIDNLSERTTYYFLITAKDTAGNTTSSDTLSFTTGQKGEAPQINDQSLTFVSNDVLLYTPKPPQAGTGANQTPPKPVLVMPQGTPYNFRFQVSKFQDIKQIQVVVRNKFVLGITSVSAEEPNTSVTDLIETQNGIFEGRLQSPDLPGVYESFARVADIHGNITETKLADIVVSQPLRIYRKDNQQPIEAAQVLLYYFNEHTHAFAPLPPQLFPIKNPAYTNLNGQIIFSLPQGKYKAHITAIGYNDRDVIFTLGQNPGQDYPAIFLTAAPFNVLSVGEYYITIVKDVLVTTKTYVQDISYSSRFFELNAVIAIAILVLLTLLSFSSRIHIPLRYLFTYFLHFAKITAIQRKLGEKITGRVFDKETGTPLFGATLYLIDNNNQAILAHTLSNKAGDFIFTKLPSIGYDIEVMADGYEPAIYRESEIHAVDLGGYLLGLQKRISQKTLLEKLKIFSAKFVSVWFETLLILSIIGEIGLGYALGWDKAFVFFICSLINLFLWLVHLSHLRSEKNLF